MTDGGKGRSPIDPRKLEVFRAVAQVGQISGAARRLSLSQPAVTAQIRQLEDEVGRPLFTRHVSGVRLTEAGRELLDYAGRIQGLLEEVAERLRDKGQQSGPLQLGASTTIAAYVLPDLLRGFAGEVQPSRIEVKVGNTEEVLAWVREGRVPVALVEGLTHAPGLSLEPYLKDELVPVRGTEVSGALATVAQAADLASVPLVWREPGSGTRAVVERALRRLRPARTPRVTDWVIGDTEAIKSCVLLGLGIGFLSRWSIQRELARRTLEIIELPSLTISRTFSWARAAGNLTGMAASFHRFAVRSPPSLE